MRSASARADGVRAAAGRVSRRYQFCTASSFDIMVSAVSGRRPGAAEPSPIALPHDRRDQRRLQGAPLPPVRGEAVAVTGGERCTSLMSNGSAHSAIDVAARRSGTAARPADPRSVSIASTSSSGTTLARRRAPRRSPPCCGSSSTATTAAGRRRRRSAPSSCRRRRARRRGGWPRRGSRRRRRRHDRAWLEARSPHRAAAARHWAGSVAAPCFRRCETSGVRLAPRVARSPDFRSDISKGAGSCRPRASTAPVTTPEPRPARRAAAQRGRSRRAAPPTCRPASRRPTCVWDETVAPAATPPELAARQRAADRRPRRRRVRAPRRAPRRRTAERLNVADTVKVQWQAYLGPGAVLLSDMGRALMTDRRRHQRPPRRPVRRDERAGRPTTLRRTGIHYVGADRRASCWPRRRQARASTGATCRRRSTCSSRRRGDDGALRLDGAPRPGTASTCGPSSTSSCWWPTRPTRSTTGPTYTSTHGAAHGLATPSAPAWTTRCGRRPPSGSGPSRTPRTSWPGGAGERRRSTRWSRPGPRGRASSPAGHTLRIVDLGGNQAVDCLLYDAADTDRALLGGRHDRRPAQHLPRRRHRAAVQRGPPDDDHRRHDVRLPRHDRRRVQPGVEHAALRPPHRAPARVRRQLPRRRRRATASASATSSRTSTGS